MYTNGSTKVNTVITDSGAGKRMVTRNPIAVTNWFHAAAGIGYTSPDQCTRQILQSLCCNNNKEAGESAHHSARAQQLRQVEAVSVGLKAERKYYYKKRFCHSPASRYKALPF